MCWPTYRCLPNSFVRDIIMKAPSTDIMNSMARGVLTLTSYDERRHRHQRQQCPSGSASS